MTVIFDIEGEWYREEKIRPGYVVKQVGINNLSGTGADAGERC